MINSSLCLAMSSGVRSHRILFPGQAMLYTDQGDLDLCLVKYCCELGVAGEQAHVTLDRHDFGVSPVTLREWLDAVSGQIREVEDHKYLAIPVVSLTVSLTYNSLGRMCVVRYAMQSNRIDLLNIWLQVHGCLVTARWYPRRFQGAG